MTAKVFVTGVAGQLGHEYGLSKAARPYNSRQDKRKLVEHGFNHLPSWQDALGL